MLNPYTLNIQESSKHAWHWGIDFFRCLAAKVLNGHSKRRRNLVFKTDFYLMQVKCIAEWPKGSILQYFCPSLSYHSSLKPLFCLFFVWTLKTGFTVHESWLRLNSCYIIVVFCYRSRSKFSPIDRQVVDARWQSNVMRRHWADKNTELLSLNSNYTDSFANNST